MGVIQSVVYVMSEEVRDTVGVFSVWHVCTFADTLDWLPAGWQVIDHGQVWQHLCS